MTATVASVIHRGRTRRRRVIVGSSVLLAALIFGALFLGSYQLTLPQMLSTLAGHAPEQRAEFFILQRRLPRAVVAAIVGAALGVSGALFQRLTGNPLASPDIIGISGGAAAGGAFVMLVLGGSLGIVALGAIGGALISVAIIFVIALRLRSFSSRVVLVGVGIAALSGAAVSYLLTQVFVASAVTAQTWLVGTLQGRGWNDVLPVLVAFVIALPLLIFTERDARALQLGTDLARGLGAPAARTRATQLVAGTALAAGAVSVTGPISFIALAAPHISKTLVGTTSIAGAGLIGGIVLVSADQIAQHAFGLPIPVGVVTVVIGGVFLLWLLLSDRRKHG